MRWATPIIFAVALGLLTAVRPVPAQVDCIVLENFATTPDGAFPEGWRVRTDSGRAAYSARSENGVHYLHAAARDLGVQAAVERPWDIARYPVLRWKWRPRVFPAGADESQSGKNDSALAVYAVFPNNWYSVRSVKYIWSGVLPKGTPVDSSHGLTKGIVLESGVPADLNAWVEERVDVAQDYRRRFETDEVPKPLGVAVLTDSDDTRSYAEGDYADFRACRE
jgi:hypothetical protein